MKPDRTPTLQDPVRTPGLTQPHAARSATGSAPPDSTIYLLPQGGPRFEVDVRGDGVDEPAPTVDPGQERFMRAFAVLHPRVHAICNVSHLPGPCAAPHARPYADRASHQALMLEHLVPLHLGAYFLLLDLDEYLTAPDHMPISHAPSAMASTVAVERRWWERPSRPLSDALAFFASLGADVVRVHWRVFGSGDDEQDTPPAAFVRGSPPSPPPPGGVCTTLDAFLRPTHAACSLNRNFKTLFRARRGLRPWRARPEKSPHQQVAHSRYTFASDGGDLGRCVLNESESNEFRSGCSIHGHPPPADGTERLVLRHYFTRSRDAWRRKMALYRLVGTCRRNPVCDRNRYSPEWARRTFDALAERARGSKCGMVPLAGEAPALHPRFDAPCCPPDPEPGAAGRCKLAAERGACRSGWNTAKHCLVACAICKLCRNHSSLATYRGLYRGLLPGWWVFYRTPGAEEGSSRNSVW